MANKDWYTTKLNAGLVKEANTQTEEYEKDHWKKEISKIVGHKTEGKKMGVRFIVKWKGYKILNPERSAYIIKKGGQDKPVAYLMDLQQKDNRKSVHLRNNQPDLAELLKDDEEED